MLGRFNVVYVVCRCILYMQQVGNVDYMMSYFIVIESIVYLEKLSDLILLEMLWTAVHSVLYRCTMFSCII